eukprot:TRINITY_DN14586_c1_g1_i1.p1 TRINITY_DN14586_c1_g1~~TRINITY_DN14586_c1_g1_i1.p1  ORF type:complete len:471 (+),score=74.49 TRINITY_DN14586_c1_g1_i1:86-1414(+)
MQQPFCLVGCAPQPVCQVQMYAVSVTQWAEQQSWLRRQGQQIQDLLQQLHAAQLMCRELSQLRARDALLLRNKEQQCAALARRCAAASRQRSCTACRHRCKGPWCRPQSTPSQDDGLTSSVASPQPRRPQSPVRTPDCASSSVPRSPLWSPTQLVPPLLQQPQHNDDDTPLRGAAAALDSPRTRQDALGAGLRLWHDEEQGRAAVLVEMQREWQANMLDLHAPRCEADDRATEDPTPTLCTYSNTPQPRTDNMSLLLPEPTSPRSPTYARECLFIDRICHWVGSFVYRDWACVCSTTARGVHRALVETYGVWSQVAHMLGRYQSSGQGLSTDDRYFGPVPGPLVSARDGVRALHDKAARCECDPRWGDRFTTHMLITVHLYEEMRLLHRQVFITAAIITTDVHCTLVTLEQTLEKYDARASATGSSQEEAPPDPSPSAGCGS